MIDQREVHIRIVDQRIGMGVGGFDTILRAQHMPTGIIVELPRSNKGQSHDRTVAMEMLEYALATGAWAQ